MGAEALHTEDGPDHRQPLNRELGRIHQVTLAGPAGRLQQISKLTATQTRVFTDTGVALPPKMTGLQPSNSR